MKLTVCIWRTSTLHGLEHSACAEESGEQHGQAGKEESSTGGSLKPDRFLLDKQDP